jgi:hypothetical protein
LPNLCVQGYCPRLQPPVLRRLQQVHSAMQRYLQEQQQQADQEQRWADFQAAGVVGKTARAAQAAASAAGSAAASVIGMAGSSLLNAVPGLASSSSSNEASRGGDDLPVGPHMRKSEQMLLQAGGLHGFFASYGSCDQMLVVAGRTWTVAGSSTALSSEESDSTLVLPQALQLSVSSQALQQMFELPLAPACAIELPLGAFLPFLCCLQSCSM